MGIVRFEKGFLRLRTSMNLASGHGFLVSLLGLVAGLFGVVAAPAPALAHPDLDAAIEHAAEADFDAALASFDAAIASGELTRDELIVLLSERSLVLHALNRDEALGRDLSLLAMLAPDRELGRAAPPPLIARWTELRTSQAAPLSVSGICAPTPSGAEVSAQVEGLRNPELGQVFIHMRAPGGRWLQKQAAKVDVSSGDDARDYYVEVRGLGGIQLAADGSIDEPLHCASLADPSAAVGPTDDGGGKSKKKMWLWIGGTGAVVVAAAVAAVIVLGGQNGGGKQSDQTVVSKPMVSF
jgi:hypothetical protein